MELEPSSLKDRILAKLHCSEKELEALSTAETASVLLLVEGKDGAPGILLNKRSTLVRQPGDLCCPGGRVVPWIDKLGALTLLLPGSPLRRGQGWSKCKRKLSSSTRSMLRLFLAASLRESFEEMGLLPWKVEFMGALEPHRLRLFDRRILPMVGWFEGQSRFRLNWEVEKIVRISLKELLDSSNYALYRIKNHPVPGSIFPCFVHREETSQEILWGATYNIVQSFLKTVFGFVPPPEDRRATFEGELASNYLTGSRG